MNSKRLDAIKKKRTTKELLEFGIINIDKPSGPTSFTVSDYVKKTLKLRKTSHFGTLDPKVTGVLPIALNRACKLTGFFLGHDKEYVGVMRFHEDVSLDVVRKAIKEKFTGVITQLPPVRSRVARREREREIVAFELLEQEGNDIVFRSLVQGGTYIRKLIHDLGEHLGIGAHMLELRRVRAGIFSEDDATYPSVTLYDFERAVSSYENGDDSALRAMITPGEVIEEVYPLVEIKKPYVEKVLRGAPIKEAFLKKKVVLKPDERMSVFCGEQCIGVFERKEGKDIYAKSLFTLQPI